MVIFNINDANVNSGDFWTGGMVSVFLPFAYILFLIGFL